MNLSKMYLSVDGRVDRGAYWRNFLLPYLGAMFVIMVISPPLMLGNLMCGFWLLSLAPAIVASLKRCHDRDHSGWFLFAVLIPVVGIIWLLAELAFLPGTSGSNRFGPDGKLMLDDLRAS